MRQIFPQISEIHYQGDSVENVEEFLKKIVDVRGGTVANDIVDANMDVEWVSLEINIINNISSKLFAVHTEQLVPSYRN